MPTAVSINRRNDGGRKRNEVNNNDNVSRPRVRRRKNNQSHQPLQGAAAAAALPRLAPEISAEQKAERRRIVDENAQKLNRLRNLPRAETYTKKKEIIQEAKQLYGAWLGENTLNNRANYLWKQQNSQKAAAEGEAVDVSSTNSSMESNATSFPQGSNNVHSPNNMTHGVGAMSVAATEVSTSTSQSNLPWSNELPTNSADESTTPSTTIATMESSATHSNDAITTTNMPSIHSHNSESLRERNDSSHSSQGTLPSIPHPHTNACSFGKCTVKNRPGKLCSEEGCTWTVHKLCQMNYRNEKGVDDDDDDGVPLRCMRHEIMLSIQHSDSSNSDESAEMCLPCIDASADNTSPTSNSITSEPTPTADEFVGCDWKDVVDGGCIALPGAPIACECGICKQKTHHLCHVNYEKKFSSSSGELQVRCSNCFRPGVLRHGSSSSSLPQQSSETTSYETDPVITHPLRKKGGRPKGVTKAGQKEKSQKKALMTDHLAANVKAAQDKLPGGKLPKGTYPKLHQEALEYFDLEDEDVEISYDTISKRIKRGNLTVTAMGPKSRPLEKVEPFILDIVKQAQEAGQPVTPSHFIELVNSLLKDSAVSDELREYNEVRHLNPQTKVSRSYYNGFMKRYNLQSTKGTRKSTHRMDDMTVDNFRRMYNLVYQRMVDAGVAIDLPEDQHHYVDREGNKTTDESKICGELCTQKVVHPDYCLFADEAGSDLCQEEDGAIGGERYITDNGVAYLRGCKNSHRFTIFPITSGTGELVMNVVIFAAKEISFITRMGLDLENVTKYDPNKPLSEQIGPGMPFPGAPKTTFRGVEMEAYITCNESGSMTGDILAEVLKKIDEYGVFERTESGPRPFFLMDAHGSRLTLPVLRYANTLDEYLRANYYLTFGCPNATEGWQVGDQSEQNGYLKMELTREKQSVMRAKRRLRLPEVLTRSDVIPILHKVLQKSFGRKESNLRVLSRLGWNPLNRALLQDPRLLQRAVPSSASGSASSGESYQNIAAMGLNVTSGVAGTTVLSYHRQLSDNAGLQQARDAQDRESEAVNGSLEHITGRLTGGKLFKAGTVALDSQVLALVEAKADAKADKLYQSLKKKALAYEAICDAYDALVESGKAEGRYTCNDMKAYIGVRRLKEDGSIPAKREKLLLMKSRLANRDQLDLKEHLRSHTKCTEEQLDDFFDQYYADWDAESEDEDEEFGEEIGQREEV